MKTESTITCPHCGSMKKESMPVDACQFFWQCPVCEKIIRPKKNDCCIYCSYGDTKCPSKQPD
ncbi:MAG: GDCCVxC domain-containing (seleno)protein [Balneolaceae bacterium]